LVEGKIALRFKQMGMLTIICPTFNRARLLPDCIESLLGLSDISVELLVVDDCSTDNTVEVVRKLQEQHSPDRVRFFLQAHNSGAQEARNRGIEEARGEFLMFVDSDDALVPDGMLQVLKPLRAKPELDYAYGKVLMTDEVLKPLASKEAIGARFEDSPVEVAGYHWHTMGPIYRRRCIDKVGFWNLDLTGSQDWEYQARVKLFGGKGEFVDTLVGFWRQHAGGRVGTRSFRPDYVRSVMKACESIHSHAKKARKCDSALERRLAKKLIVHAIEWGANGFRREKRECVWQAAETASSDGLVKLAAMAFAMLPTPLDRLLLKKIYQA
jgi:glycosyltransferase involved in cell wall biosynthesis